MKYIFGSLIISFGILFVAVVLLVSLNLPLTENVVKYLGLGWIILAIIILPFAKKVIRE